MNLKALTVKKLLTAKDTRMRHASFLNANRIFAYGVVDFNTPLHTSNRESSAQRKIERFFVDEFNTKPTNERGLTKRQSGCHFLINHDKVNISIISFIRRWETVVMERVQVLVYNVAPLGKW